MDSTNEGIVKDRGSLTRC